MDKLRAQELRRSLTALDLAVAKEIQRLTSERVVNGRQEQIVAIDHCYRDTDNGIRRHIEVKYASGLVAYACMTFIRGDPTRPVYQATHVDFRVDGLVVCPDGHAFFPAQAIPINNVGNVCPVCYTLGYKFVGPRWGPHDICPKCKTLPLNEAHILLDETWYRCNCGTTRRMSSN